MLIVVEQVRETTVGAVLITSMAIPVLLAYLKQYKKPDYRRYPVICFVSSILGVGVGWVAVVICSKETEPSFWGLRLLALGTFLTVCPLALFPRWFVDWVAVTFKTQPRQQRLLFRIGKTEVRSGDIVRVIILIGCVWSLVEIWRLHA